MDEERQEWGEKSDMKRLMMWCTLIFKIFILIGLGCIRKLLVVYLSKCILIVVCL